MKIGRIGKLKSFRSLDSTPSIPPTVRYSCKKLSNSDINRNILKDLTKNKHDFNLTNFAWSGMSGYEGFAQNYKSYIQSGNSYTLNSTDSKTIITRIEGNTGSWVLSSSKNKYNNIDYVINITVNKTSAPPSSMQLIIINSAQQVIETQSLVEGINYIKPFIKFEEAINCYFNMLSFIDEVTIEQLPIYPNGLVFDGINDFGQCIHNLPLKTIIMKCQLQSNNSLVFDQRAPNAASFALYTEDNSVAFRAKNLNGKTYINDKLNNEIAVEEFMNKDIIVAMTNDTVEKTDPFIIGKGLGTNYYAKMVLYDFVGYDRVLTQEETKLEIEKYKLGKGEESKTKAIARYSAKNKTNANLNRDILKDLTGNRHDIQLKNFAWSGMSGYEGFAENFNNWTSNPSYLGSCTDNKWIGNGSCGDGNTFILSREELNKPSFKIRVTGLTSGARMAYRNYVNDEMNTLLINRDGEEIIPESTGNTILKSAGFIGYGFNTSNSIVTIEQIPLYPNGLVFDGVNDYGECINMPIMTDYTVIAKRKYLKNLTSASPVASKAVDGNNKNGAFMLERINTHTYSYTRGTEITKEVKDITWQTKNSYNGMPISSGTNIDTNSLTLGAINKTIGVANIVIYDFILYDKSLTSEEIQSEIKKYNL